MRNMDIRVFKDTSGDYTEYELDEWGGLLPNIGDTIRLMNNWWVVSERLLFLGDDLAFLFIKEADIPEPDGTA